MGRVGMDWSGMVIVDLTAVRQIIAMVGIPFNDLLHIRKLTSLWREPGCCERLVRHSAFALTASTAHLPRSDNAQPAARNGGAATDTVRCRFQHRPSHQ